MIRTSADIMDEFSGMPLPLSPMYAADRPSRFAADDHHSWHDRLNPLLQDIGGKALRASRVQHVNYDMHHLDYHGAGLQPVLPTSDEHRLRPIILAAAGYVPKQAIAFTNQGKPYHASLSAKTREKMWAEKTIHVESVQAVRKFLCKYVLEQDLSDLSLESIDEFLHTPDEKRKWELGNDFLGRASRRAASPIEKFYGDAYKSRLIPAAQGQIASRFILGTLGFKRQRKRLFPELETKLTTA